MSNLSINVKIPIKGGLGNQMFGYVFYLKMKDKGYKVNLSFIEYLFTYTHNGIELLNIFPNITINNQKYYQLYLFINKIFNKRIFKRIFSKLVRIYYKNKYNYITQQTPYRFEEYKLNNDTNYLINGFWQNYLYCESIENKIRNCFQFKIPRNWNNKVILKEMQNSNSVSIHIRRGDYLHSQFSDYNVIKTMDYFNNAIAYIKKSINNPVFFIFSDDIEWCKKHFIGKEYVYVIGNTGKYSYLDMYMMSNCKHNIISNSTFSWWGAWLNNNNNKIVIAPFLWTNSGIKSEDFCPKEWIFCK